MKIDKNLKEEIDGVVHYRVINSDGTLGGLVDEFTYNNRMIFVDDGTYISKGSIVTNSIIKASSVTHSVVKNSDLYNSVISLGSVIEDSKLCNCTGSSCTVSESDLKSCIIKNKSNLLNINMHNKEFKITNVSNLNKGSELPVGVYHRTYNIRPFDFVNINAALDDRDVFRDFDNKITNTNIIYKNGLVIDFEKALNSVSGLKEITRQLSVVTDSNILLNWEDRPLYEQVAELVILRKYISSGTELKIISSKVLDISILSTISVTYDMYKNNNYYGRFRECIEVIE